MFETEGRQAGGTAPRYLMPWAVNRWHFMVYLRVNVLLHTGHLVLPLWIILWCASESLRLKERPHVSHTKGPDAGAWRPRVWGPRGRPGPSPRPRPLSRPTPLPAPRAAPWRRPALGLGPAPRSPGPRGSSVATHCSAGGRTGKAVSHMAQLAQPLIPLTESRHQRSRRQGSVTGQRRNYKQRALRWFASRFIK